MAHEFSLEQAKEKAYQAEIICKMIAVISQQNGLF